MTACKHKKHMTMDRIMDQLLEKNVLKPLCSLRFSVKVARPQSDEGSMHQVPRLRIKVVRGFPEFSWFGREPVLPRPPDLYSSSFSGKNTVTLAL